MRTTVRAAWKVIIFITGITVIFIGIILLAIPGPGLLTILAGFLILSLEFEWAKKWRDKARKRLDEMNDKVKQQRRKHKEVRDKAKQDKAKKDKAKKDSK